MVTRSTLLHLRIPFSFFLMPVFLFALAISPNLNETRLWLSFVIIHLFLYPASNGYNSYFDKDEGSIGGLKNPPPVDKSLYYISLVFDAIALALAFTINITFVLMLLAYGLVSKAYSHPSIRLKKYGILSWLITGFFQGFFSFLMCYVAINQFALHHVLQAKVLVPGALCTLMLWANYPMTQIYQHEEDRKHGDTTMSILLGKMGTFYFAGSVFFAASIGFALYFFQMHQPKYVLIFLASMLPVVTFFAFWLYRSLKDRSNVNYRNTMRLNIISSLCLNGFFVYFFLDSSQVLQAVRGGY